LRWFRLHDFNALDVSSKRMRELLSMKDSMGAVEGEPWIMVVKYGSPPPLGSRHVNIEPVCPPDASGHMPGDIL